MLKRYEDTSQTNEKEILHVVERSEAHKAETLTPVRERGEGKVEGTQGYRMALRALMHFVPLYFYNKEEMRLR